MIKRTWVQMGMPVTVCIAHEEAGADDLAAVAAWFDEVDQRFSPYRETSEVCRLNAGAVGCDEVSAELASILRLCAQTKAETGGYFEVWRRGRLDPSGLVKGWAIQRAGELLAARGFMNYFVDAGGDVLACGLNGDGRQWRVGIRNPFKRDEVVKVLALSDRGVATSGTAIRGEHIYNPWQSGPFATDLVSLTVIGPTVYEADRMATAAFAMGSDGIAFVATWADLEGYAIAADGVATFTEGFQRYVQ
jgi:thiamine biosynthesis lipoprotein